MSDETTGKGRFWLLPAGRDVSLKPGLYLVATPIGNLADISLRALDVLSAADLIACEDTRVSGRLLSHYGIKARLLAYNDHNAERRRGSILEKIGQGGAVALISDAGTPLVSDPGYKLVCACIERGFYVTALPGANAPLTALQLSGLPTDKFAFLGFLPPRRAARRKILGEWSALAASLIIFESAPRLEAALEDLLEVFGDREIAVAREMTKLFEEVRRGSLSVLLSHYREQGPPKGEIVVVVAPPGEKSFDDRSLKALLAAALKTRGTKEAAAAVAEKTGQPRKRLYAMALEMESDG